MRMFVQFCVLLIIILLGLFVFKTFPFKASVKHMTLAAAFIIIALLLDYFSVMIPLFGFPSLKIEFSSIPMVIAGMILGPSYGFIIGLCIDIIGLILVPTGFPFLGFTLSSILRPVLPALWIAYTSHLSTKSLKKCIIMLLSLLIISVFIYVSTLKQVTISKQVYIIDAQIKLLIIGLFIIMACSLVFISLLLGKKLNLHMHTDLLHWIMIGIIVEVGINVTLTPIWLQTMYGIPWIASLLVRILKSCIMIPLNVIIGYSCYETIKHRLK